MHSCRKHEAVFSAGLRSMTATATAPRRQRRRGRMYANGRALVWLAPALFLVGFFIVWPIGQVIIDSFTNKTLNDVTGRGDFIGLTNYRLVVQG